MIHHRAPPSEGWTRSTTTRKSRHGRRTGSKVRLAMTDVDPVLAVTKLDNDGVPGLFDDWKWPEILWVKRRLHSVNLDVDVA